MFVLFEDELLVFADVVVSVDVQAPIKIVSSNNPKSIKGDEYVVRLFIIMMNVGQASPLLIIQLKYHELHRDWSQHKGTYSYP